MCQSSRAQFVGQHSSNMSCLRVEQFFNAGQVLMHMSVLFLTEIQTKMQHVVLDLSYAEWLLYSCVGAVVALIVLYYSYIN